MELDYISQHPLLLCPYDNNLTSGIWCFSSESECLWHGCIFPRVFFSICLLNKENLGKDKCMRQRKLDPWIITWETAPLEHWKWIRAHGWSLMAVSIHLVSACSDNLASATYFFWNVLGVNSVPGLTHAVQYLQFSAFPIPLISLTPVHLSDFRLNSISSESYSSPRQNRYSSVWFHNTLCLPYLGMYPAHCIISACLFFSPTRSS